MLRHVSVSIIVIHLIRSVYEVGTVLFALFNYTEDFL